MCLLTQFSNCPPFDCIYVVDLLVNLTILHFGCIPYRLYDPPLNSLLHCLVQGIHENLIDTCKHGNYFESFLEIIRKYSEYHFAYRDIELNKIFVEIVILVVLIFDFVQYCDVGLLESIFDRFCLTVVPEDSS